MEPVLRAKFVVNSVKHSINNEGEVSQEEIEAHAVYANGGENGVWSKYTPSGQLKMNISNPGAFDRLRVGTEFYLDFTPAPEAPKPE